MPHPTGMGHLGAPQLAAIFVAALIAFWFTHRSS